MKKKIKKICGFFGCCVVLLFSIFSYIPQIKAESTPVYYIETTTNVNQITFIFRILDAYTLENFEVELRIYNNSNFTEPPYVIDVEFLRDVSYDVGDYDAYTTTHTADNYEKINTICYVIPFSDYITLPETDEYWYISPNVFKYNEYYTNGYNIGHIEGVQDGKIIAYDSLEPGEPHYDTIYNAGKQAGETAQINTNFFVGIFEAFDAFFNISLGGITIGAIILIPLSISLAWFIIKSFRGGGD